jgi:hypothetical protein
MAFISVKNSLTDLFGVFFVVVFLKLSDKLEELLFGKGFFLVVELFHKGQKNQLILVTDLACLVKWVIQGADYFGQEL